MTAKLPTSLPSDQTGRHGVTILQDRLEAEGWVFRRQGGDSDFGVDGEIEVVRRNSVTGHLVKCQVKSTARAEFVDGRVTVRVAVATYNLWRRIPLPTLLFLVGRSEREIYWIPALAHHPRPDAASLAIGFEEASALGSDLEPLREYLDSWFASRSTDSILDEVPPMWRIRSVLDADRGQYDAWTEMWEEREEQFRQFYGHTLRLRLEVGLSNTGIPSLADWRMRSDGMWGGAYPLFWGTFDEAMHVIGPAYEEALERMLDRLAAIKLTVANQELWNFVQERRGLYANHVAADERAWSQKFHRGIEDKLRGLGLKPFVWTPQEGSPS